MLVVRFDTIIVVKFIYSDEDDSASLEDELEDWWRGAILLQYVKVIK